MTGQGMNGQLFCRVRAGVTLSFKLGADAFIGRDQGNAVAVPVEGVSRNHARIRFDGKDYWLEDLKSTNGTFLNGLAVTRDRLRHLDVITLGRALDLVFVLRAAVEVQKVQAIVRAALVREGGGAAPYEIALGEITLGRAPSNNLVADTGAVSKVHARIERTRGQLVLQDLGSARWRHGLAGRGGILQGRGRDGRGDVGFGPAFRGGGGRGGQAALLGRVENALRLVGRGAQRAGRAASAARGAG